MRGGTREQVAATTLMMSNLLKASDCLLSVCSAIGACSIFVLMMVNVAGFGAGAHGAGWVLRTLCSWEGALLVGGTLVAFFCAAHLMLEVRAREANAAKLKQL